VQTWPAPRKPCTRLVGEDRMAVIAGGTSTWDTNSEKFFRPSRWACTTDMALAGAVVSKPTPKNTTSLSGFSAAICVASSGEYTIRTSPPRARTLNRSARLPGTRNMSPKEQKMTSWRPAISRARSIISSGVTHTGHPGPCTNSTASPSSWSIPLRMIECVWPPHTSMIVQVRPARLLMCSTSTRAAAGSRNSSRYFMPAPDVPRCSPTTGRPRAPRRGCRGRRTSSGCCSPIPRPAG